MTGQGSGTAALGTMWPMLSARQEFHVLSEYSAALSALGSAVARARAVPALAAPPGTAVAPGATGRGAHRPRRRAFR